MPFEEIAPIVDRSPDAARQLASRARRRVRGARTEPDTGRAAQQEVVDAFVEAAREGDFDRLITLLDPDVVLRTDRDVPRGAPTEFHGARTVAGRALQFSSLAPFGRPALVNGTPGFVGVSPRGKPFAVAAFTVVAGRITEIDFVLDPDKLSKLELG
jgi:hypothetical protein